MKEDKKEKEEEKSEFNQQNLAEELEKNFEFSEEVFNNVDKLIENF